jgi:hypothetical protein
MREGTFGDGEREQEEVRGLWPDRGELRAAFRGQGAEFTRMGRKPKRGWEESAERTGAVVRWLREGAPWGE